MQKLCVLIPYRDRADHLAVLLPRLTRYLEQDAALSETVHQVCVVEQDDRDPFNKGALLNAGFSLVESNCDYVCLHDVDFVPIDADYTMPRLPTRRIWQGAESRPREPGGVHIINHRFDKFFGGVLLFQNCHFRQVNGFSNRYRGWGYEDGDLRERCRQVGLGPEFGEGHFEPLDHVNRGLNWDLTYTDEAQANRRRYEQCWGSEDGYTLYREDGLNSVDFRWRESRELIDNLFGTAAYPTVHHFFIELKVSA